MGLKYVVAKQVFAFDETKSEKYVVKQVSSGKISFSKLCTQVGQICGAHRGTVQLVIAGLVDVLVNNIEDGKSVQLGEFGTFRPAINAKAADTEEEANATKIYRKTVKFTPGAALKNTLENASVTRYASPDTDYTTKGKDNGGSDWDDDDDFVDPTA
ncbi:HU family DNA-binding protein [Bacteroides sp.]|uniref:HU family DNA-binding protein n=1 Tax=Bacteroides sp. TaxID=29523 RepID=UPI0025C317E7|nr:HU family DNA-binding protein [Bacteroides sp.]